MPGRCLQSHWQDIAAIVVREWTAWRIAAAWRQGGQSGKVAWNALGQCAGLADGDNVVWVGDSHPVLQRFADAFLRVPSPGVRRLVVTGGRAAAVPDGVELVDARARRPQEAARRQAGISPMSA